MQSSERGPKSGEQRAAPPRLPKLIRDQQETLDAAELYLHEREKVERRSVLRGLLLVILLILAISILRAGPGHVFVPGWWRP